MRLCYSKVQRDRSPDTLGLSQKAYIDRVLKRFNMNGCSLGDASIVKGTSFLNLIALRIILRKRR